MNSPEERDDPFAKLPRKSRTPNHARPFVPGDSVDGRYQVEAVAGWSEQGRVYRAVLSSDQTTVALKVADGPESRSEQRMAEEFERLRRLSHSNIPSVYEAFLEPIANRFCIVMEFVDGVQLRELVGSHIEPIDAARAIADIADALDYLHSEGFFHRDLKPENLLLDRHGNGWLLDLGSTDVDDSTNDDLATSTPDYLPAMLQLGKASELDWTAETASLGVILKELLTGITLASEEKEERLIKGITVSRTAFPESVPEELQLICTRSLQTRELDSYVTAGEFADDLRSWIAATGKVEPLNSKPPPSHIGEANSSLKRVSAWRAGRYVSAADSPMDGVKALLKEIDNAEAENDTRALATQLVWEGLRLREAIAYAARYLGRFGLSSTVDQIESSYQSLVYQHGRMTDELFEKVKNETSSLSDLLAQAPECLSSAGEPFHTLYLARFEAEQAVEGGADLAQLEQRFEQALGEEVDYQPFLEGARQGLNGPILRRLLYVLDRKVERWLRESD